MAGGGSPAVCRRRPGRRRGSTSRLSWLSGSRPVADSPGGRVPLPEGRSGGDGASPTSRPVPWRPDPPAGARLMAQTSYYVPNIHVNGDLYKGRNCLSRLFSSKAEDAACARYEARVLGIIDKDLWGTWTGCRVLQQIKARTKKSVEITPYTTEDAANPLMGLHNAYAAPTNARDAAPANEVIYMGNSDDYNGRTPGWDERYDLAGYDGTGQGSDSYVHFTA